MIGPWRLGPRMLGFVWVARVVCLIGLVAGLGSRLGFVASQARGLSLDE